MRHSTASGLEAAFITRGALFWHADIRMGPGGASVVLVALLVVLVMAIIVVVGAGWSAPGVVVASGGHKSKNGAREHYGPPPGAYRALSEFELPDRGYPEFPREYEANSASSISHMIERSA
jgi:hypothetical protein